ncbi:hypothetical protein LX64_02176 [Chitinophaga skermanii]|uniref:Uncharacterized protein n=1 Tax=Chitinophaga skermanii TaxID=331697 RepID=A0A327QMZ1_9BACT|nr:hypothetical protein [Chitinophaga skermanii]RAJ05022.1 hypothetical protein LX64_02176 [Chitinophaga skermanii]
MKLRMTTGDVYRKRSEASQQRILRGRMALHQGIRLAADEEGEGEALLDESRNEINTPDSMLPSKVYLWGVVRPLIGIKGLVGDHCFLQITPTFMESNNILQSVSYGQSGGGQPDVRQGHKKNVAYPITEISSDLWLQMKEEYKDCGKYDVISNNCCTCATSVLARNGLDAPQKFFTVNHKFGTDRKRCVIC